MNDSIFKIASSATQHQIMSIFNQQLDKTSATICLIEQYQVIVSKDNHQQINTANIEVLAANVFNQIHILEQIYFRLNRAPNNTEASTQPSAPQDGTRLVIDEQSSILELHDFISLQLTMTKAALACFVDIEQALNGADGESYEQALQHSITSIKNMLEQLQQAAKHLQHITPYIH